MNASDSFSHLSLVLGGARSGKSQLAFKLAGNDLPKAFVATGEPGDAEMSARIQKHQQDRDPTWNTHEIPIDLIGWFNTHGSEFKAVIVDCLTLWLSNLLGRGNTDSNILSYTNELMLSARKVQGTVVFVSNEVGMGIVPGDPMTRQFRDLAGKMNQHVAGTADSVYFSVSGLPMKLK